MTQTLGASRLSRRTPPLIVVGPPSTPADPGQQLTEIRDALQKSAQQSRGTFADPLALGWFQGSDSVYIGPDGEHPTATGEQHLAQHMEEILTPPSRRTRTRPVAPRGPDRGFGGCDRHPPAPAHRFTRTFLRLLAWSAEIGT